MGCDREYLDETEEHEVSIHAPAWGATYIGSSTGVVTINVSIHAPAWGATLPNGFLKVISAFQSTHPHGVRLHPVIGFFNPRFVSIHAPAWGATIG